MRLIEADDPQREQIMDGTYPVWGEGLSREAYSRWNRAQMATPWGRDHLRRVAIVDDTGDILASAKRYDFDARAGGERIRILGIGAVFTPESKRGRGYARTLIELMMADAAARGGTLALLFSEIGPAYYETLGFQVVQQRRVTLEAAAPNGSPAMLVRSGDADDLPVMADISARYTSEAAFALERSPGLIGFGLARRRLLAGLGPPGLRDVEFFVTEEAHRAAAYVVVTRGPRGRFLEDCGDRDPTGARIGAMLQVLAARAPVDAPLRVTGWLPASLRPPQVRVVLDEPANDIMMVRSLVGDPKALPVLTPSVYWPLDLF
jgi:predicted N-acetyltransferase YhbS